MYKWMDETRNDTLVSKLPVQNWHIVTFIQFHVIKQLVTI